MANPRNPALRGGGTVTGGAGGRSRAASSRLRCMPIDDDELETIRVRPAYRAAIWLMRLGVVEFVFLLVRWVIPHVDRPFFAYVFPLNLLIVVPALYLLHRAGVPFERRATSWRVRDREVLSVIRRDVFGIGPRR
jgi:hypothetical protein